MVPNSPNDMNEKEMCRMERSGAENPNPDNLKVGDCVKVYRAKNGKIMHVRKVGGVKE